MKTTEAAILVKNALQKGSIKEGSKEFYHYLRILHAEEGFRILSLLVNGDETRVNLSTSRTAEKQAMDWLDSFGRELGVELKREVFVWNFRRMVSKRFPKAHEEISKVLEAKKLRKSQKTPQTNG